MCGYVQEINLQAYQGMDASSWTIVAHNPELGMNLKGVIEDINVFGLAIGQLLQNLDLVDGDFDGIVFGTRVDFIVGAIDIDNFQSDHTIVDLIKTKAKTGSQRNSSSEKNEQYATFF